MGFLNQPKSIEELEEENERASQQLSITEKKALIAKAKQKYGKDWMQQLSRLPKVKSGMDWEALRFRM